MAKKSKEAYDAIVKDKSEKYQDYADCFDGGDFFIYAVMYYHRNWKHDEQLEDNICDEFKKSTEYIQKELDDKSKVLHYFKRIKALSFSDWADI